SSEGDQLLCVGVAEAPSCAPPTDVQTADEILAHIAQLEEFEHWSTSIASGGALRPTPDLRAASELVVGLGPFRESNPACLSDSTESCVESSFVGERSGLF